MKYLSFLVFMSVVFSPTSADAADMEGQGLPSFVNADIGGWQLQCNLQMVRYQSPSRCLAVFQLSDGEVVLRYSSTGLEVAAIGKCGDSERSGAAMKLPVSEIAAAVENAARGLGQKCKPPVLTAALFQSLPELNTVATILAQRLP